MKRILFVTNSLGFGGAAKILSFVANNLDKKKFEVGIHNLNTSPTFQKIDDDIKIFTEKAYNKRIIRGFIQLIRLVKRILSFKPVLIISFLGMPNFLSILAGKITKTPVIISERGDPNQNHSRLGKIVRFTFRFADGIVFQTDDAKDFYPEFIQKKSRIIANPVIIKDESATANLVSPSNEISFVARFENIQKRQDIMLEAFKKVSKKYPDMILKFYGIGPDEDYIKELAVKMGLKDKVKFMGLTSNPIKEISNSRVFVLTSDYEGIPNALIEAMAIGLPVVATDCSPGGARMLIENEVNGLLVPRRNSKAIADAIIRYIKNPDFAKKCGQEAKKVKIRFAPEKIIREWEEYITIILGEKHESS